MRGRDRGAALVVVLLLATLAALLALGAARSATIGLRIAEAGLARARLVVAADNGLEHALARGVPAAGAVLDLERRDGAATVRVRLAPDARQPRSAPPLGGYGMGLGTTGFVAEHYVAEATAVDGRGARLVLEQQVYALVPEVL